MSFAHSVYSDSFWSPAPAFLTPSGAACHEGIATGCSVAQKCSDAVADCQPAAATPLPTPPGSFSISHCWDSQAVMSACGQEISGRFFSCRVLDEVPSDLYARSKSHTGACCLFGSPPSASGGGHSVLKALWRMSSLWCFCTASRRKEQMKSFYLSET